jgi:hypothetical protein
VSSSTPGAAFGGTFLLGQPPPAGAALPSAIQPATTGFADLAPHVC